jgi:hypothetical protein
VKPKRGGAAAAAVEREEWLRDRILALESGAYVTGGLVAPLLAMGARVRGDMADDLGELDPQNEELLEWMEPPPRWPDAHRALCWRLIADAFAGRYSDALLNLQADALERASGWHLQHEPDVAMVFLARRARLLSYASWGEDKVLASLDAALAVHRPGDNPPAAEYELILQALEVLDRIRSWRDEEIPRSAQVLALGVRGLDLADEMGGAPQRARLCHAVADGLARDPAPLDDHIRARLVGRFGTVDPTAVAEAAWHRAVELEDGDFYGEVTARRRDERLREYRWGLALLDLERGAMDSALAVLEVPPPPPADSLYEQRQHAIRLLRLLAAHGVSRQVRLEVLVRAMRRDLLGGPMKDEFAQEQAVEYLDFARYQLANLNAGPDHLVALREVLARPGMAEHIAAARAKREAWDARTKPATDRLVAAMTDALEAQRPRSKREAARRRAAQLASETPAERAERVSYDISHELLPAAGADLLVGVRSEVSPAGDRLVLRVDLACPEFALDAVRADPAVAAVLASLERRIAAELPGCAVEMRVRSRSLAVGPGDDPWTGPALAAAGASAALAALGIEASPPADLDHHRQLQRERRRQLFHFA